MSLPPYRRHQLILAVDRIQELRGAGIAYISNGHFACVRPPRHTTGLDTWLIVEETVVQPAAITQTVRTGSWAVLQHRYGRELLGTVINCGGAGLAYGAEAAEAAAIPETGGASALLIGVTHTGAVLASAQCGMSAGRLVNAFVSPESNDWMDQPGAFHTFTDYLDIASQVITVVSLSGSVAKIIQMNRIAKFSEISRQVFRKEFRAMSSGERVELANALNSVVDDKTLRQKIARAIVSEGKFSTVFTRKEISSALGKAIRKEVRSALLSTGLGVGGSALPSEVSSTGGVVHEYMVRVLQE